MATVAVELDPFEKHGLYTIESARPCWVCADPAWYVDVYFEAPVCGAVCWWAAWEAFRLHDTPFRAW
jgi:hypothetical protein